MKIQFQNVFIISEEICRDNLQVSFWPIEYRRFKRQKLIDENKREGWACRFLNNGLLLDSKIFIHQDDYKLWPENHKTLNINTRRSELEFFEKYEEIFSEPALVVEHPAELAENVRKKIYISERFKEQAHMVWAAQLFETREKRERMKYYLGFDREITTNDRVILKEIESGLLELRGVLVNE